LGSGSWAIILSFVDWLVGIPVIGLTLAVMWFLIELTGRFGLSWREWLAEWRRWTIGRIVTIGFILVFLLLGVMAALFKACFEVFGPLLE